ncbi:MAG: hypothetical protein J6F31_07360 [Oscillospiraceae bacterium]|nr:hypothetical protein [Oscillospiraceae bacterium]
MDTASELIQSLQNGTTTTTSLVFSILSNIGMWMCFSKAGEPGWAAIIPIYNVYVMFKLVYGSGWRFLLLLIPIVNLVVAIACVARFPGRFGKGILFSIAYILFNPVMSLILGFTADRYIGPAEGAVL